MFGAINISKELQKIVSRPFYKVGVISNEEGTYYVYRCQSQYFIKLNGCYLPLNRNQTKFILFYEGGSKVGTATKV